jgi:eukaryotic-like serine/threonine-protein kinase
MMTAEIAPAPQCATCGEPLQRGACMRCLFQITFAEENEPLDDNELPWTRLASCELYEEIGRGGMGVVYRARQRGLDRIVAVKVLLRANFAGKDERDRFQREAQAAARLRHHGIVSIIDVGEDDGVPWFSMEHIAGQSLEQRVRDQLMTAKESAGCLRSVAEALQHAHEHGVLHRDLKPSNILMDQEQEPHITDFGIARIGTSETTAAQLTRTGQMLGSPGYAAPEQVLVGSADVRTDVYGLGALLYHLLTGRPPFQGPTLDAILVQLRDNEPLSPSRLNPSVPRDLETICLKCLEKNPAARYPTAAAVMEDLGRFLEGKAIQARPVHGLEKAWRWTRRNPAAASMLGIIALLIVGLIVGSLVFARQKQQMERRSVLISEARSERQTQLVDGLDRAKKKLRDAWDIAPSDEIRAELNACLALPEISSAKRENLLTPNLTRSADYKREAVFEGDVLVIREVSTQQEIIRWPDVVKGSLVKLDDHGERMAIVAPGGKEVRLLSVPDGRLLASCVHPQHIDSLDWSGDLIATACHNRFIYIWSDRGDLKHRLSGHESADIRLAFRPHSQELASSGEDVYLRLWHAAKGEEILTQENKPSFYKDLWWNADGTRLFGAVTADTADVYSVSQAALKVLAPPQEEPHSENLGSASLSGDGRWAAVIDEQSMRVWDIEGGNLDFQYPKKMNSWFSSVWAVEGDKLWTCGWEDNITLRAVDGWGVVKKFPFGVGGLLRSSTADGKMLVLSNNSVGEFHVVPTDGDSPIRIKHPHTLAAEIAEDGSWLITVGYDELGAKLWSLPEGAEIKKLCENSYVVQVLRLGAKRVLLRTSEDNYVLRTTDWTIEQTMPEKLRLASCTTSRDGAWIASLSQNNVRLIETQHFRIQTSLTMPTYVGWLGACHLVFDSDASHLLLHTALGSVCRWDLKALKEKSSVLLPEN